MEDPLVVVITGASSGIGRATAQAFAARGARVVLAARRAEMLEETAEECRRLGGEAVAVATDVTREEDVQALAARTIEHFGYFDVWFNNAGVGVFGKFEDIPTDAWRRVIETNLFGYVYGCRAALAHFRQRHEGVLINNASIAGRLAHPDATAYVASKFAVRGLAEGLRQELLDEPDIDVCTVLPAVIDTPFFQHAANFSGHGVQAIPPVYPPEQVAETVVGLVERPRAEVVVGSAGKLMTAQKRLMPGPMTAILGRCMHAGFFTEEEQPASTGALFEPPSDHMAVRGGWRNPRRDGALAALPAVLAVAGVGLLGWAVYAAFGARRTEHA